MDERGTRQLERTALIDAPVEAVYRLFTDNSALPEWAPVVDAVLEDTGGDELGVGRTRTCAVTMNGRTGTMVERCVDAVPGSRVTFAVIDDSFGFKRLLRNYSFTAHFSRNPDGRTLVRIETFYDPANPLAAVLNRVVLRRKFRTVVDNLLAGLRITAEHLHATS